MVKLYENHASEATLVGFKTLPEYPNHPIKTGRQDDLMSLGLLTKEGAVIKYQGLFKPPTTGDYKFRAYCDHKCEFLLSTDDQESHKQKILKVLSPTGFFEYK